MRTTQQFSITLPNEMADTVKSKVAAGEYATAEPCRWPRQDDDGRNGRQRRQWAVPILVPILIPILVL